MVSKGGCAIMSNIENNENEILSFEELRKKLGMDEAPVKKTVKKDDLSSLQNEIETKPIEKKQETSVVNDIAADIDLALADAVVDFQHMWPLCHNLNNNSLVQLTDNDNLDKRT